MAMAFPVMMSSGVANKSGLGDVYTMFDSEPDCFWFDQPEYTFQTTTPYWVDIVDAEKVPLLTGEGVYVAVIDTGILTDWEVFFSEINIAWEYAAGFSHYDEDIMYDPDIGIYFDDDAPVDYDRGPFTKWYGNGHGSHVASTILGYDYVAADGTGYHVEGIAPEATLIPIMALDSWMVEVDGSYIIETFGTDAMLFAAYEYLLSIVDELDGPLVVNMSYGGGEFSEPEQELFDAMIEAGIILVTSAGNSGEEGLSYPAAYDPLISVAAGGWTVWMNNYRNAENPWYTMDVPEDLTGPDWFGQEYQVYLAGYSSRPNADQVPQILDLMSIGEWVVGPYQPEGGAWAYYYVSGTSMASPNTAGTAALIMQAFPWFEQHDMEWILKKAAAGERTNMKRGFLFEGTDVLVGINGTLWGYPSELLIWDIVSWERDDFGMGFLHADAAMFWATLYALWGFWR